MKINNLTLKIVFLYLLSAVVIVSMVMLPAGSVKFWQGWLFCGVILIPQILITLYFSKRSPDFLERRMNYKEKELSQKIINKILYLVFLASFLVPGFDYRYGWSAVPFWLVIASDVIILAGFIMVFLSFKENNYAARTVEVFQGQKVIDTGPYSVVRHPMYADLITIFLFIPLALGSFWAVIFFVLVCVVIIFRIYNEEDFLKKNLPGYVEYCQKVRYRLIPYVW